jgi:hypothetical protein
MSPSARRRPARGAESVALDHGTRNAWCALKKRRQNA